MRDGPGKCSLVSLPLGKSGRVMNEQKIVQKREYPSRKGVFACPLCFRQFAHAASLSRHRLRVHNGCHYCMECKESIPASTTLRSHFLTLHSLSGVVTCACCNWAFTGKRALHAHIKIVARGGVSPLEGVLAITDDDHDRMVEQDTVPSLPTVSLSPPIDSSSCSVVPPPPPPPPPLLPSVDSIRSEEWKIPIGINESTPDFDLLVEELTKDSSLLTALLISTQMEHNRLNELVDSMFPRGTVTASVNTTSLTPSSSASPNNKRKRLSIDEVADMLMKKKLDEMKN